MVRKIKLAPFLLAAAASCFALSGTDATIKSQTLSVAISPDGTTFSVKANGLERASFTSRVGVEIDHQWLWSTDYPHQKMTQSSLHDKLGSGRRIQVELSGLPGKADLSYFVKLYDDQPFGSVRVQVKNPGKSSFTIQNIRVIDVTGSGPRVDLGGPEQEERVLSDSFSEDRPPLHIFDLGKAKKYEGEDSYADELTDTHFAVGSQLIYNRTSRYSLLLAALTSDRWLTLYHLKTQGTSENTQVVSYTVDSAGTTEVMKKESIRENPAEQQIELSLPLDPGKELESEEILFSVSRDYHEQLESYGQAIRQLHHARVSNPAPWGWWSWTAYYFGLSQSMALTNAKWMAKNLLPYGFNYFHIDEGNSYADGEYVTPNATLFPDGIRPLSYKVTQMGLNFGIWVAPFRVSKRAWVYEKHPEWLVHDAKGNPISIGYVEGSRDPLYVLDTTHPGAQAYLEETYQTLVRSWNVRYIKMDFMDDTAIEGFHYRPNTTAIEAERIGLKVIREAVGPDVLLDKDGSPMLVAVGYTDLGRISTDTGHSYPGMKEDATGIAARYYMNGNFYQADPDAFTVTKQLITDQSWHQSKAPLTLNEAEVSITLAAISGGMFEIGDDLPTLGAEPERLDLVRNKDLLDMVRLGRASNPIDLMTYQAEDEQPSIFFLQQDDHQAMLAVFNWTDKERSHLLSFSEIGYKATGGVRATDVFRPDRKVELSGDGLRINAQAPHSVRLIKLVDTSVPAQTPIVKIQAPEKTNIGQSTEFRAATNSSGTPATQYHWDFGDGTGEDGAVVRHAYTRNGPYTVMLKAEGLNGASAPQSAKIVVEGSLKTTYEVQDYRRFVEK